MNGSVRAGNGCSRLAPRSRATLLMLEPGQFGPGSVRLMDDIGKGDITRTRDEESQVD